MAAPKTYLVQTWDKDGSRTNHYEALLIAPKEVTELKAFLRKTHELVLITLMAKRAR